MRALNNTVSSLTRRVLISCMPNIALLWTRLFPQRATIKKKKNYIQSADNCEWKHHMAWDRLQSISFKHKLMQSCSTRIVLSTEASTAHLWLTLGQSCLAYYSWNRKFNSSLNWWVTNPNAQFTSLMDLQITATLLVSTRGEWKSTSKALKRNLTYWRPISK